MKIEASLAKDSTSDCVVLVAPEAENWLRNVQDTSLISLRFAAASVGVRAYLAIGLRVEGRGIDLLLDAQECGVLREDPSTLLLRTSASASEYAVIFDDAVFDQFLQVVHDMHQQLPDHFVWKALDDVLLDE